MHLHAPYKHFISSSHRFCTGYRTRQACRLGKARKSVLSSQVWGGANVLPRYVNNGIEDAERSYWGGNILQGPDGSYHLFVCGWPESSPKGHAQWPQSIVYHTSSKNRFGPYTIQDTIGSGHNPEIFRLNDGRLVLYCIDKNYVANSLNGPWTEGKFEFDAAVVRFSSVDEVFYGKLLGIKDLVSFEGSSVRQLKKAFHDAVDDYLETCKALGKEPDKT